MWIRYDNGSIIGRIALQSLLCGGAFAAVGFAVADATAAAVALVATMATGLLASRSSRTLVRAAEAIASANVDVLEVLGGAVAKRESGPNGHNHRVVLYAVQLAEALGLPAAQTRTLIKGAFVDDLGNIVLSDALLHKPGRLDETEFEAIKTHCYHGADIVSRSSWLAEAADVVRHHHEKWDGTGYPLGLKREEIPITARVFAIVDVFDALTSPRPYRQPLAFDKAMEIMLMGRGGHFDPSVFDVFAGIARRLYDDYRDAEQEVLAAELRATISRYFLQAA